MKVTVKGFVHAEHEPWQKEPQFVIYPFDMSKMSNHRVLLHERDIEIDVPDDFDPRAGLVANLEREKEAITAAFQARITEINGQIQSLLAIENHAEAAS